MRFKTAVRRYMREVLLAAGWYVVRESSGATGWRHERYPGHVFGFNEAIDANTRMFEVDRLGGPHRVYGWGEDVPMPQSKE